MPIGTGVFVAADGTHLKTCGIMDAHTFTECARTLTEGRDMSPSDLVTRLARKWSESCEKHRHQVQHWCCDSCIAAAIREALEEAEKVARNFGPENYPVHIWPDEVNGSLDRAGAKMARVTSENIAAALAALRGGP